jgi:hypothetical protein
MARPSPRMSRDLFIEQPSSSRRPERAREPCDRR